MTEKEERIQKAVGTLKTITDHIRVKVTYVPKANADDGILATMVAKADNDPSVQLPFTNFEDLISEIVDYVRGPIHDGFVDPEDPEGEVPTGRCKSIEVMINVTYDPNKK